MEWKRVKSILIAVLLLTCLLLAANILWQVRSQRVREKAAVRDACAVALQSGVDINADLVLALPVRSAEQTASRNAESEQRLADALLGTGCIPEEPGGGVSIFENDNGRIIIRRGGALEIHLTGRDKSNVDWTGLLQGAGLKLSRAGLQTEEGVTSFSQYTDEGVPIFNCMLSCSISGEELLISGRWLLEASLTSGDAGRTRAELTLALAGIMEKNGAKKVLSLTQGYSLQSDSIRRLELTPVWTAETDAGIIILNTVTKKTIPTA
ncbi:MAG: hypothetical protein VB086_00960 [Clostridiaceae bacterium]|nr:hypothetical protein [Clostridiaceae bacterium]